MDFQSAADAAWVSFDKIDALAVIDSRLSDDDVVRKLMGLPTWP